MGIAFQSLKHEDVENIGYVIPTPVIMHFIKDYEKNGAYTGMFISILRLICVRVRIVQIHTMVYGSHYVTTFFPWIVRV